MDCSTPGLPVLGYLPELAQIHVGLVGDAIQPSHPLLLFSPFAFNLSQHQGLFQWVGSSYQVAKVWEIQHQYHSFQWIFRGEFPSGLTHLISLQSKGLSRVFSNTTVQKHWFFSAPPPLWLKIYYLKFNPFWVSIFSHLCGDLSPKEGEDKDWKK